MEICSFVQAVLFSPMKVGALPTKIGKTPLSLAESASFEFTDCLSTSHSMVMFSMLELISTCHSITKMYCSYNASAGNVCEISYPSG